MTEEEHTILMAIFYIVCFIAGLCFGDIFRK